MSLQTAQSGFFGRRRALRVGIGLTVGLTSALAFAGCSEPLMSERDPRTQYDRYDLARNNYAQQYVEDEFGRKQPNLRGRLGKNR